MVKVYDVYVIGIGGMGRCAKGMKQCIVQQSNVRWCKCLMCRMWMRGWRGGREYKERT